MMVIHNLICDHLLTTGRIAKTLCLLKLLLFGFGAAFDGWNRWHCVADEAECFKMVRMKERAGFLTAFINLF